MPPLSVVSGFWTSATPGVYRDEKAPNKTKICKQHRFFKICEDGEMETESFVDMEPKIKEPNKLLVAFFNKAFVRFQKVAFVVCILWGDLAIMFHPKAPI